MKKALTILAALMVYGCSSRPSFESFPKIDAHFHLNTSDPAIVRLAEKYHFKLMTLVTGSSSQEEIGRQLAWASHQQRAFPRTVAYSTTLSMKSWGNADWQEQTLSRLRQDFAEGAVAVKIWKDIGMTFREPDGRFIFIDDPAFDPVFDFIAAAGKTVVGHLGEPRNCWLPLDLMTTLSDRSYFAAHPQYHMYLHPDYPSYEQQIAARDRLLAKHPGLRFVGAHLGSLEWNVDELAKRLAAFPNMAVDMAARICHFQVQDSEQVRRFIIRYQDRLLYGTDLIAEDDTRDFSSVIETWKNDWRYFTTDEIMTSPSVRRPFKGLALPASVLKKIYYQNAVNWLGGWKDRPAPAAALPASEADPDRVSQMVVPPVTGAKDSFTFAVVGDSREGGFLRGLRGTVVKDARQLIVNKIAESEPAFVVNTGDLVKQGAEKKEWREFEKMNQVFKDKKILYCPILGNHDYGGNEAQALAGYFECFPALNN
jgi:predicted TIM-barrel fold metal-dependent hydrolase